MVFIRLAIGFAIISLLSVAYAQDGTSVQEMLRGELASRYPGARIAFVEDIHWMGAGTNTAPSADSQPVSIVLSEPNARGQVQFTLQSKRVSPENDVLVRNYGWVTFQALQPARVAIHRVMPGEEIRSDQFTLQEINVASGAARDYRGVILSPQTELKQLEARQTILEGQPLFSTAVQKTPDVRKGDAVRVQIISNGLTLSTQAQASEPAYMNGHIRVLTEKTKRELTGTLVATGVVEVRL